VSVVEEEKKKKNSITVFVLFNLIFMWNEIKGWFLLWVMALI